MCCLQLVVALLMLSHYLPSTRTSPIASSRLPSLPEQPHPSRRLISAARGAQTDSATHRATVGVSVEVRTPGHVLWPCADCAQCFPVPDACCVVPSTLQAALQNAEGEDCQLDV